MTVRERETKALLQSHFKDQWEHHCWVRIARDLKRGAEILFEAYQASRAPDGEPIYEDDLDLDRPATLLYGYAVENAIKAVLIKQKKLDQDTCKAVPGWPNHDLWTLIRETGISVTEQQQELLCELTAHVQWAGKYPAAFTFEGSSKQAGYIMPGNFGPQDWKVGKHLPPSTFDYSKRRELDAVFCQLLEMAKEDLSVLGDCASLMASTPSEAALLPE